MNTKIIAILFIFINNFRTCQCISFHNYSLYNVVPTENEHLQFLQNLDHQKYIDIVFWKKPYKLYESAQVMVNPNDVGMFIERTQHYKLKADLLINDVQRAFENQRIDKNYKLRGATFTWDMYHTLDDIYKWLSDMAVKYPDKVNLVSIGKSSEGTDIYVVSIKTKNPKFSVIVEGGIHGNEWISVEAVTYLLNQLVSTDVKKNHQLNRLLKKYDWHLIPVVNPDGYIYSQTMDRLWRKNRRKFSHAYGVDLNRNFNYSFGKFATSYDETDDSFSGPHPFSEPETKALSKFLYENRKNLRFYFSFHGYGQKIIIPYADRINHIENFAEAEHYGKHAIARMSKVNGVKYELGSHYDTLGLRISGNSGSYVKKTYNVRYVYTFLLRDNGTYGYALPPQQILPTCQEAVAGIAELMAVSQKKLDLMSGGHQLTSCLLLIFISVMFII